MESWEAAVVRWANGLAGRSAFLDGVMYQLADGWIPFAAIAVAIGFWLWKEGRLAVPPLLTVGGGIVLADFAGSQIKHAVQRPRPCQVFDEWHRIAGCGDAYSMPSNHVLNTAVAAGFLQVLYPKSGWITWPLVVIQAFSRMFVVAHYPSDVLVGGVLGSVMGVGLAMIVVGWRRRRSRLSGAGLASRPSS